jgi:peptide chain release factor
VNPPIARGDKEAELQRRLEALGVAESDLEESFVRSQGPGGQNVNKAATCVLLVHRPTGLRVKCQESRQQGYNRTLARARLLDKIEADRAARLAEQRARIEKRRRQARLPSAKARRRMRAEKLHRASKKQSRRPAAGEE